MYLASALSITLYAAQVSFCCPPQQQILPRFCLRAQLLTRP